MDAAKFWIALASSTDIVLTSTSSDSTAVCMKVLNKAIESRTSKIAKKDKRIFFNIFSPIKAY